jgi:hypothetical protein
MVFFVNVKGVIRGVIRRRGLTGIRWVRWGDPFLLLRRVVCTVMWFEVSIIIFQISDLRSQIPFHFHSIPPKPSASKPHP